MDLTTAKAISDIASPFTKMIVDKWLTPKFEEFVENKKSDGKLLAHTMETKFSEYLTRSFEKQSYVRTLVFQNLQKRLDDLYVPLTLETEGTSATTVQVVGYPTSLIPTYKRVLITDTAGMGKSTILRYLFLECIRNTAGVPLFIELRHLSPEHPILDHICDEINAIDRDFDHTLLLKLISRGDFVFFLDGYDEIPLAYRDIVTSDVQRFLAKAGSNHVVISSRPESALVTFADFRRFTIKSLRRAEAFDLLRKYGNDSGTVTRLISSLKSKQHLGVREFLTNPLLVSLLFLAYHYRAAIPIRKPTFYRQVFDALFQGHDLTKPGSFVREKKSGLDYESFERVLRSLAYQTVKLGKVEYEDVELLQYINVAKSSLPGISDFKETDFLSDLKSAVPLFVCEGSYYRWQHKSIQEYFAAQFICIDAKAKQSDILRRMVSSPHFRQYINVLDLCYDIDFKAVRNSILRDMIEQFIVYSETTYQSFRAAEYTTRAIDIRRSLCFRYRYFLAPQVYEIPHMFVDLSGEREQQMNDWGRSIGYLDSTTEVVCMGAGIDGQFVTATEARGRLVEVLAEKPLDIITHLPKRSDRKRQEHPVLPLIPNAGVIVLDDIRLPINQPGAFDAVNDRLLECTIGDDNVFIDVDKCRSMLVTIEQSIKAEVNDELLSGL